jgi:hypothetical protein
VLTILQLSDLHRSAEDPVGNGELLAALESDRGRWPHDVAHHPDLIVVSGDLVQGVPLGTPDSDAQLAQQYQDAAALLDSLIDRFLDSDRSRLILVPGNHDIDWCTARSAMAPVDDDELQVIENQLPSTALDATSPFRWSWRDRQLFKVTDHAVYASRCQRFLDFRRDFYAGVSPDPLRLDPDLVFIEYPSLDVSVTGLSSWFGNDCYCHVGAFNPDTLAVARDAIAASTCGLHMAVWHHSVSGPPASTDFLDVQLVHRLIDYGYRVGLHGHHHRTDAAVMTLRLPTKEELALVSAGSLAAGSRELPTGINRQYTVLGVDPAGHQMRVHVREAIGDLIFAASPRTEFGGESFMDVRWSATPAFPGRSSAITSAVDDAYAAYAAGDLRTALERLHMVPPQRGPARRLLFEVLQGLGDWDGLRVAIGTPETQDELMVLIEVLCQLNMMQEARRELGEHSARLNVPAPVLRQLETRIDVKESTG